MRTIALAGFMSVASGAFAGVVDYLPAGHRYAPEVPTPEAVIGHEVGEWHVRHDQLVRYAEALAAASPRVALEVTGRTHEQRPLLTLTITAPENHPRLEALRARHLKGDGPLVLWLGYSIHGNEASGSNAALVIAYHLAATQGDAIEALLADTVILIDPSLNPDGLGRFAQWVNGHRGVNLVAAREHREHQEVWPGGRFNHYWFDLNRDWLLLTHPESRARVGVLQRWRPHLVTDFHEMGSDQTYFFQPGVPNRRHPLTPGRNAELTARLAEFHARALDAVGQPYFSEEVFDDFYYGKGSTYPDAQGMIGVLFEQASPRGHLMATERGELSFRTAVRNQVQTSLSSLAGAAALRAELRVYRRWVDEDTQKFASSDRVAGYVFGDPRDPARTAAMAERLLAHGIEVYELTRAFADGERRFEPGAALLVPTRQPQYRLLKSLFERRTEFEDSTFYDVSAWNFASAFDLPLATVGRVGNLRGQRYRGAALPEPAEPAPGAAAYAIEWDHYFAPKALARMLADGLPVRVATRPFRARTTDGERGFGLGTLIVPARAGDTGISGGVSAAARSAGVPLYSLATGLTPDGPDLGSGKLVPLKAVKPLLVTGSGVSAPQAGEVWHLLDTRIGLPPVMVDTDRLVEVDLNDYTHVLMVDGEYERLDPEWAERLRPWIAGGGVLVATQRAAAWATVQGLHLEPPEPAPGAPIESGVEAAQPEAPAAERPPRPSRPYGEYTNDHSATVIGGAIVAAAVDTTHPLAYGLRRDRLALFRQGTVFLKPAENPYETPLQYLDEPLISGYLGPERRAQLAGSAAAIATKRKRGAVIRLPDNPNFRGFWYGTNRLYFNALFFAQILEETPLADTETRL